MKKLVIATFASVFATAAFAGDSCWINSSREIAPASATFDITETLGLLTEGCQGHHLDLVHAHARGTGFITLLVNGKAANTPVYIDSANGYTYTMVNQSESLSLGWGVHQVAIEVKGDVTIDRVGADDLNRWY